MEMRFRMVKNASYSLVHYDTGHDLTLRYSRPAGPFLVGGEAFVGRDVFRENFRRFDVFMQLGIEDPAIGRIASNGDLPSSNPFGSEVFFTTGLNAHRLRIDLDNNIPIRTTGIRAGAQLGIGARRSISERGDIGVRFEFANVDGQSLLAVRALDYRYRTHGPLAFSGFLGAARYNLATPAYGMYGGIGTQWRNAIPGWDLGLDLSSAFRVARDHLLPSDPSTGGQPDSFYDVFGLTLSLSHRF